MSKYDQRDLRRAAQHASDATVYLANVYDATALGFDDQAEVREHYATLTKIADRLREIAKRA